jgi:hypothetical protein
MLLNYKKYDKHYTIITAIRDTLIKYNIETNNYTRMYLIGGFIYGEIWGVPIFDIDIKYVSSNCPFTDKIFIDMFSKNISINSIIFCKKEYIESGILLNKIIINDTHVKISKFGTRFDTYFLPNMSFSNDYIISIISEKDKKQLDNKIIMGLNNKTILFPLLENTIATDHIRIGKLLAIMVLYDLNISHDFVLPIPEIYYEKFNVKNIRDIMYIGLERISKHEVSISNKYDMIKKYIDLLYKAGWWNYFTYNIRIKNNFPLFEDIKKNHYNFKKMFVIASVKRFGFGFADRTYFIKTLSRRKIKEITIKSIIKYKSKIDTLIYQSFRTLNIDLCKYEKSMLQNTKNNRKNISRMLFIKLLKWCPYYFDLIHCFIENYEYAKSSFRSKYMSINMVTDTSVFDY